MALHPTIAATRNAVRPWLAALDGNGVIVACSGGADSLALAAAVAHEAPKVGVAVTGVTVDHQLQDGSGEQATRVADQLRALGITDTIIARVSVTAEGLGPEAAAREARYDVLGELATRTRAGLVLLGHTLDDQAETVLLGLTRGSGGRSLSGMRRSFEVFARPFLELTRAETETACLTQGLEFWNDPHNLDDRFTRVRVRTTVLPMLEDELGPGVAATLARTADQLRADTAYLDAVADAAFAAAWSGAGLDIDGLPGAIATRVLRLAALEAGAIDSELFWVHIRALLDLATSPVGGRQVQLPGHVTAYTDGGQLRFRRT